MYKTHKDFVKEAEGIVSREYIHAMLVLPEIYYLDSLADFPTFEPKFKMTGKRFGEGREYRNSAVIVTPISKYRLIKDIDLAELLAAINKKVQDFAESFRGKVNVSNLAAYQAQKLVFIQEGFEEAKNAVLYDQTGFELRIHSQYNFTDGTLLPRPQLRYSRNTGLLFLQGFTEGEPQTEPEKVSMLETLLTPQFS